MSSFLGFCEGDTRNRWRDGQVCPDMDKELWRLGTDGSGVFWRWTSVSRCGQGTMAPWDRRLGCVLALDKCVQMWTRNYGALGQTARLCFGVLCANRTREVKRDFCDLRIRSEGRVVNTPLVVNPPIGQNGFFRPTREASKMDCTDFSAFKRQEESKRAEKKDRRVRERERTEGGGKTEKREMRRKETERESGRERVMPALNGEKG
ncbi:hypothetical protein TNCV_4971721 [Trichonephila clavipes]|nr:hypothetical protein TNCV_4971721 [Trichonephila clavipes]